MIPGPAERYVTARPHYPRRRSGGGNHEPRIRAGSILIPCPHPLSHPSPPPSLPELTDGPQHEAKGVLLQLHRTLPRVQYCSIAMKLYRVRGWRAQ